MLRSIVGWLVAAPILVAMLLAGCSNEPATPSLDGSAPLATGTPQRIPTATPTPFAIPTAARVAVPPPITPRTGPPDRAALVALYEATGGPNWENSRNWLSERPLSEWYGVSTDGDGRVIGLHLYENGLSGSIPAQLGSLSNLEQLRLSGNSTLSGPLPRIVYRPNLAERAVVGWH